MPEPARIQGGTPAERPAGRPGAPSYPVTGRSFQEVLHYRRLRAGTLPAGPGPFANVSPRLLAAQGRLSTASGGPGETALMRAISPASLPVGRLPQRVFQREVAEYRSAQEAATWGPSACSAATLTAVLRSRGSNARIADVIDRLGPNIDRQRGLLDRRALSRVASELGLANTIRSLDYNGLRQAVQAGQPVMTDVTNAQFPAGHWLVVTGVDDGGVTVVDSSGYNLTRIDRQTWERSWSRSALVVG